MTVTPLIAAQACFDLYGYSVSQTKWDFMSPANALCYFGITKIDGTALVCFRGSTTIRDFLNDLMSDAKAPPPSEEFNVSALGLIHPGAWHGLEVVLSAVLAEYDFPQDIQFTGHSLGAMRATLATATFAATFGHVALKPRIVFGECASGYRTSADLSNVAGSQSFVSHDGWLYDPLYGYPFRPGYTHGTKPTVLKVTPDGTAPADFVGPLALHFQGYYLNAIKAQK